MSLAAVRRPGIFVSSVAFAVLVCACGGSTSSVTPGSAAPSKSASAPAGGSSAAFCDVVKSQATALRGGGLASLLTGSTPDAWKAYFKATSALNQQLVDAAPAEIKPSVQTLQQSTLDLQAAMAAAGYDPSKMGAAKLTSALASPARVKASTDFAKYVMTNCTIDLTKP